LIEDFMIATNGVTAAYLESKKFPSLRRVLRSPERWDRIADLASQYGDRLPGEPDAVALEAFLVRRRKADPEKFPDLSLAVVKLIGRGEYVLDLPGIDFVRIAEGLGCDAVRVSKASELAPALARGLAHDGVCLIEVMVDSAVPLLYAQKS
jgi:hypothetical protein